jgi:hypothetical protein
VISQLGTGKSLTFFYSVEYYLERRRSGDGADRRHTKDTNITNLIQPFFYSVEYYLERRRSGDGVGGKSGESRKGGTPRTQI